MASTNYDLVLNNSIPFFCLEEIMRETMRVAIYIRVSTLDQAENGYSLDMQEYTLTKWCQDRRYEIAGIYADRGISGKSISHRPAMCQLLKDAENKSFDIVWACFGCRSGCR